MKELILSFCLAFPVAQHLLPASPAPAAPAAFSVAVKGAASRPAMILIPGLASGGEVWDQTVARYQDRFHCHVVTLAGFAGVPAAPGNTPFLQRVRQELIAYIRAQKLDKPIVMGHSLGGYLAMDLAIQEPKLVGSLIIVDSLPHLAAVYPPGFDAASMRDIIINQSREQYEAFIRSGASLRGMVASPEHLALLTKWSLESDQRTVALAMYELFQGNLLPDLPKIQSRSLVIGTWAGMKDFTTREQVEKNFRAQYQALPNHTFALADTARHFVMYDEPNWFFTQVDQFLNGPAKR